MIVAQPDLTELVENFQLFEDWEERYRYLIDLGKALPPMDEALKNDETFVKGCTSQVWLFSQKDEQGLYHFIGDSDAHIVRGLIAVLFAAFQGKSVEEIASVDIKAAFEEIGLNQHLSPNRRNGFFSMVERIKLLT
ncbi:MAG: SufE family protein [Pseudomonadota bacterium]